MVFKSIEKIKTALPEVIHIVMFYNNGIIFQTTFEQSINIPKLGENLAQIIGNFNQIYDLTNQESKKYEKIIFETESVSIIILKLGEDSNIALFFKGEESKELKLHAIKRYLTKIEELIDMDKKELILQEILHYEADIENLKKDLQSKKEKIDELKNLKNLPLENTQYESNVVIDKECDNLQEDYNKIETNISDKQKSINQLKEEIQKKDS
ncbi:MAG: hypothetical protein ACQERB_00730 [Promethearchaeati archaeon]